MTEKKLEDKTLKRIFESKIIPAVISENIYRNKKLVSTVKKDATQWHWNHDGYVFL